MIIKVDKVGLLNPTIWACNSWGITPMGDVTQGGGSAEIRLPCEQWRNEQGDQPHITSPDMTERNRHPRWFPTIIYEPQNGWQDGLGQRFKIESWFGEVDDPQTAVHMANIEQRTQELETQEPEGYTILIPGKEWHCVLCSTQLQTARKLSQHITNNHNNMEVVYRCRKCGKSGKIHSIECHASTCSGFKNTPVPDAQPFRCTECPLCFNTNSGLGQHVRHRHPTMANQKRIEAIENDKKRKKEGRKNRLVVDDAIQTTSIPTTNHESDNEQEEEINLTVPIPIPSAGINKKSEKSDKGKEKGKTSRSSRKIWIPEAMELLRIATLKTGTGRGTIDMARISLAEGGFIFTKQQISAKRSSKCFQEYYVENYPDPDGEEEELTSSSTSESEGEQPPPSVEMEQHTSTEVPLSESATPLDEENVTQGRASESLSMPTEALSKKAYDLLIKAEQGLDTAPQMKELLGELSEKWAKVQVPKKQVCTEKKNNKPKIRRKHLNSKFKEMLSYKLIQRKWADNRKATIRKVLDLTEDNTCQIPVSEVEKEYRGRFEKESCEVNLEAFPKPDITLSEEEGEMLTSPITPREVRNALLATKALTAAGPDGVAAYKVKASAGDGTLLATLFNVWLIEQRIPDSLKEARSILLPKGKTDLHLLGNWRPLTIGSILARIYTKILAKRLTSKVPLNPMQRGFIPAPGVSENILLLDRIIRLAKKTKGQLSVAFLDLAKAFDTVSHDLVQKGLERFNVPTKMLNIVQDMYTNVSTSFTLKTGTTNNINIKSGVKQGDPLSPILFDIAMDPLFCLLKSEGVPWNIGATEVVAMGYADDTAVLSKTPAGMRKNLELVQTFCTNVGLRLNVKKSFVFHIKATGKTFTVNNIEPFIINGEKIPWINPDESTKYLGKQFGPWQGMKIPELQEQLKTWATRIRTALLKPEQKVEIYRSTVIPRLVATLAHTKAGKTTKLRALDDQIRKEVTDILHLPEQITTHLFYTQMRRGGLGLLQLESQVPRGNNKAYREMLNSKNLYVRKLATTLGLEQLIDTSVSVKNLHHIEWAKQKTQGKGAQLFAREAHSNSWLKGTLFRSGEYITALKLRTNTYPTRECLSRGGDGNNSVLCRRCNLALETIGHISGSCHLLKRPRIKRHESICKILAQKAATKGWVCHWEPSLRNPDGEMLRPDLIFVRGNHVVLVDPTVVMDTKLSALSKANTDKVRKYECLKPQFKNFVSTEVDSSTVIMDVFGLPIGARGAWFTPNNLILRTLGLHRASTIKALTSRALGGTIRLAQIFSDNFNFSFKD